MTPIAVLGLVRMVAPAPAPAAGLGVSQTQARSAESSYRLLDRIVAVRRSRRDAVGSAR